MSKTARFVIENSTFQYVLALVIWVTICGLYIMERAVPDTLLAAGSIVLGFYFHNVAQKQAALKGC